jgi:hypothetical protein
LVQQVNVVNPLTPLRGRDLKTHQAAARALACSTAVRKPIK